MIESSVNGCFHENLFEFANYLHSFIVRKLKASSHKERCPIIKGGNKNEKSFGTAYGFYTPI